MPARTGDRRTATGGPTGPGNGDIARMLRRAAELLRLQEANPFRVRSYEQAAETIRNLDLSAAEIYRSGGEPALRQLEHIGPRLAGTIGEIVDTGRSTLLDRLEGELRPGAVFTRVPGIGESLAERIHEELGIDSLEELEQAAHDGRLARIEGVGRKRLQGVRDALAGMLGRASRRRARQRTRTAGEPPVDLLLEIDAAYRRRAEAGELRRIAPRRFNPGREAWLPIMSTGRSGWRFTAMYSNTRRAHELGRTRDWVVIYYKQDDTEEQCTVVTATSGPMRGRRVVRGRERESRAARDPAPVRR